MAHATLKRLGKGQAKTKLRALKPGEQITEFTFEFDEMATNCTVYGIAQDGSQVDISGVATLEVTSSDPGVCDIADVQGMTFTMKGVKSGSAAVTSTATWTDGSAGPFAFNLAVNVTPGPVGGVVVVPGAVTPQP